MTPLYFSSEGNSVLGVYHPAQNTHEKNSPNAVVICPPFGHEGIRAHKCLLSLANRLAKKGTHVLRFAYRGTDDSALWSDEIQSLQDWNRDIVSAKEHLMRQSGCSTVMLLGLRLGANLAVQVASESEDVHSIVLWEPIENGLEYLESLRTNQKEMIDLWHCKLTNNDTEEIEELFSTRYQRCLLAEIEQIRLETRGLRQPTLIVSAANPSLSRQQSQVLQNQSGIFRDEMERRTEAFEPNGWKQLEQLEEVWWRPQSVNLVASEVQEMFRRVESFGWHRDYAHTATSRNANVGTSSTSPKQFVTWEGESTAEPWRYKLGRSLALPQPSRHFQLDEESAPSEKVVQFGDGKRLSGVLSEPLHRSPNSPVMIMLNAGIVHRVGPFRLHVNLARVLSKQGFASLRIDLSGLGDSRPRTGKQTKNERVLLDVSEAMQHLQNEGFGNRFVLFGLCSGAYQAHQVAVSDSRVVGAVFQDGIVFRTLGYYARHHLLRLFRPRFWRNAIKRRWLNALRQNRDGYQEEGSKLAEAEYFHVDRSRQAIAAELFELKKRPTQMLFVYTGDYDDICGRSQFSEMYGIKPDGQLQVDYLAKASHTFRIASQRDQFCRRVANWMKERFS